MPETMNAVLIREQGAASVLKTEQVAQPRPAHGEVLIKIRACALNHLDIWCRKALPVKLPMILGCDVAGDVVELGPGVSSVATGTRVMVAPGISCGACALCLSGEDNLCRRYSIIGEHRDGGYAEFITVPAVNCFLIPQNFDYIQAAAIPLVFITAWHMLLSRADLKMGETLLVIGGGSGVGSAAIQIGKLMHCRVLATVGDDAKAKLARELGADEIINHGKQKIFDDVKRLTDKRGVDVIFEHVGPAVWNDCMLSLANAGRLVTCGATTGPKVEIDLPRLFMKNQSVLGSMMGTKSEFAHLLQFVEQGKLKPVVDKVFPLSQAKEAHEYMESRALFGKVVLDPTA